MGACSTSAVQKDGMLTCDTPHALQTKGGTPTTQGAVAGQGEAITGDRLWQKAKDKAEAEMVIEFGNGHHCERCSRLYAYVLKEKAKRLYSKYKHRKQAKDKKKGT